MAAIGRAAADKGYRHIHLDTVGSTNAEALRLGGDRLWVTAGEQTAGRGRRGRDWASPPGNLYASLLLAEPATPAKAAQLSFVAAVALADAVAVVAPRSAESLGLKWPNDLLVDGAKAAGILIEAVHGRHFSAVVGCGVNVAHHPPGLPYPATHLAARDPSATADALFEALSSAFAERLEQWQGGLGFAATRSAWLQRAAGLGQPIQVKLADRTLEGQFEALTEEGVLLLRDAADVLRPISAGDVFLTGTAGAA